MVLLTKFGLLGFFFEIGPKYWKKTFYFVFQEKYLGHHLSYSHYTPMNAVWVYQHIEQFNKFNKFILKAIKLINHTRFFVNMLRLVFYIFYMFSWNFNPLDHTNLLNLVYYSTYYWSVLVTILAMGSIPQI